MEELLKNIQLIIKEKGFTQEVMADKLGISQSGLNQILSGRNNLKIDTLLQIAINLKMSIIDLITYPDKYVKESNIPAVLEPRAEYMVKKRIDNLHDALVEIEKLQMEIRLQNRLLEEKERLINTLQQTKK